MGYLADVRFHSTREHRTVVEPQANIVAEFSIGVFLRMLA